MKKRCPLIIILFISSIAAYPQESGDAIIDGLIKKFRSVSSYQAEAIIRPDIAFLKMLPQKATIFFKQPDQFRIQSPGISILPKQNIDNVFRLLMNKESYESVVTMTEVEENRVLKVITVIPSSDTADLMLAKLWVEEGQGIIRKARLTTRSSGTIFIRYTYGKFINYGLPDEITFTIDVKKFKIPKALSAGINSTSKPRKGEAQQMQGTIYVTVSKYRINSPIPDEVFQN